MSHDARRRNLVWGVTWLAYASYYLGRKGFSAAKHRIKEAGLMDTQLLGVVDTAYLAAYALGQFGSGALGDRIGARRLVGFGLLASAALCAACGSVAAALPFLLFFALNGAAQATGWPGTMRAMSEWTTPANRGTVMGLWSTCYQVGPFVAGPVLGLLIHRYDDWRPAFFAPAFVMVPVALLVLALVRSGPEPARKVTPSEPEDLVSARRLARRAVLRSRTLWCYGACYFFIKFTRYTLAFWLPFYLSESLGYSDALANGVASAFEGGGVVGVIAIGALSDRRGLGRVPLSAAALLGLALALFASAHLVGTSTWLNGALFALVGALLFAPDSIVCGAAAQDAGGRHAAAMSTGFVNGVGSVGALVEGLTVPLLAKHYGWSSLFPGLVVMAVLGAACLLPVLREPAPAT
ncbi:MAG: Glycerol-3-phosphate transporter [Polyangiaceae bacterium]|jgi:OPA family sugar phosphate sensor protein UhpC-like MFS transporter|nr:Glycerol-3-phosphate transporter [Polyangiaceae bacterium]